MRLDRRLSEQALGSRREVQALIRAGQVAVDGQVIRDPGAHTEEHQEIRVRGEVLDLRRTRHLIMNKPGDVLTAARDRKQKTVMDLLPPVYASLGCMPVGRLDRDTTGVLFFTTDGELNHRLLSPARHVDKVYRATVDLELTEADVLQFARGLDLGDFRAEPAELVIESPHTGLLTIHEGKFHQVKRMFEAVGKTVTQLDRRAFGPLSLETIRDLAPGTYRELTDEEARAMYLAAGMENADG